jgi:peptidoglycan/LPS O-acetylase OafA/YrhL
MKLDQRRADVRASLHGVVGGEFRPDVEGLRAIAVIAVVLFHMKVAGFEGGFVGVDVFFVVSGFLITQLLLRELEVSGTVSLHDFWARRARRLLPASCLVLVVTVIASRFMLAPSLLREVGRDAIAAGLFVVNFVFANRLGDYFNAQLGDMMPSPLLHFWSLAVEEQFYLLWPATLLVVTRWLPQPAAFRRNLLILIAVISAASLIASVWMTVNEPTWAFYLLPARAVELLAGATLAVVGTDLRSVNVRFRAALGWFGVIGVVYAVLAYDKSVAFPGTAALLPVLSTVLIVASGGFVPFRFGPGIVLSLAPMQWIGRHSYAIYLWHWPVLVLSEAQWGPLSMGQRTIAVAVALLLSVASKAMIEDPIRLSKGLSNFPGRSVVLGLGLSVLAVLVGLTSVLFRPELDSGEVADAPELILNSSEQQTDAALIGDVDRPETTVADLPPVVPTSEQLLATLIAANREVLDEALLATDVPGNLRPLLSEVNNDRPAVYPDGCVNVGVDDELRDCRYGAIGARRTIVLYGDSHAAQWAPAMDTIAFDAGYELIVLAKGGCPTADVSIATNTLGRTCPTWRDNVVDFIAGQQPTMVVVTAWHEYDNGDDEWSMGLESTLSRIAPNTANLVLLADSPGAAADPQQCLSSNRSNMQNCSNRRERAVEAGRINVESAAARRFGATFVDPSDWFCAVARCPLTLGDVLLFRDTEHITTTGAEWFRPLLEAAIRPILDDSWLDTQAIPENLIVSL